MGKCCRRGPRKDNGGEDEGERVALYSCVVVVVVVVFLLLLSSPSQALLALAEPHHPVELQLQPLSGFRLEPDRMMGQKLDGRVVFSELRALSYK